MGVFSHAQLVQIRYGLRDRLDVAIYADPKYDDKQMDEIREGLAAGLDVAIYADPKYNDDQMEEIRLSLGKKRGDAE